MASPFNRYARSFHGGLRSNYVASHGRYFHRSPAKVTVCRLAAGTSTKVQGGKFLTPVHVDTCTGIQVYR